MMKLNKKLLWSFLMMMLLVTMTVVTMVNVTSASPETYIYMDPAEYNAIGQPTGHTFWIYINVTDAPLTYGWELFVSWDPDLVEVYFVYAAVNDFLSREGYPTFLGFTPSFEEANLRGEIMVSHTFTSPGLPMPDWASGDGWLVLLGFRVKAAEGSTLLNLFDTTLGDHYEEGTVAYTYYPNDDDCFFYNVETSHDITFRDHTGHDHRRGHREITDIKVGNVSVFEGAVANINVTVLNEGTEDESVTLNVYANESLIDTTVLSLNGTGNFENRSITHEVAWDTTGFAWGNYTISANATIVPVETDTADNTLVDDTARVRVMIPGDVERDDDVDYDDLVILADAYGSSIGQPAYDLRADFDRDEVIDIYDLAKCGKNYGRSV